MSHRRVLSAAAAMALLCVGVPIGQPRQIDDFFADFTAEWVRGSPNLATRSRYFAGAEQEQLERRLTPEGDDYRRARIALARKGLKELGAFDRSKMSAAQQLSADLLQSQLDTTIREEPYLDYTIPLQQMNGVNVTVVEGLTVAHPLASDHDAVNYLAALGQVEARMDEAIARSRRLAARAIVPPAFILQATIKQMRTFVDGAPSQNPFVATLAEKMQGVTAMTVARRTELLAQAESIVSRQVYPVWKRAIAELESQVPRAGNDAGLWRLEGGAAAYEYFLRRFTTTNLSGAQIHDIGLREVDRLEKEMDQILRRLGRTEGPLNTRIATLKKDLAYAITDEGRTAIMADVKGILADAQTRSAALFEQVPKSAVVAQPFPRFREANAAANYNAPAPDGSRPGTFQIPLRPERMTKFGLRSLVYHETVPGHHFQIALQVENRGLPRFRQIGAFGGISALSEGWGLYAERLAAEAGWYDGDPEGLLGQLDSALFRARRLVVDTGIHLKHWTRQQAIDYGIEASEVERYVVYPGQACSYMIGQLKLVELREKARQALGSAFNERAFHAVVLDTGTVPLEILERQVDQYISAIRGRR
jgi:uncharacterized protein (DUF885 family)